MGDFYGVLGLTPSASDAEIRHAYKKARRFSVASRRVADSKRRSVEA